MHRASKNKMAELQAVLTKMPLRDTSMTVLPEFGVKWKEISQAIRSARLPMTSANVAWVLCRHVSKHFPLEEVAEIVARLRLKLVVTQNRVWHVVRLLHKRIEEPVSVTCSELPDRLLHYLRSGKNGNRIPEVQTLNDGDLVYISLQMVSGDKEGVSLFAAVPPGEPVALFSSLSKGTMIRACVQALGYKDYEDAKLYGRDINSLLRINNRTEENYDDIEEIPEYEPTPIVMDNGIDYTYKTYNENYIDNIIGPNPPLLTDLTLTSTKQFFDSSRLSKLIKVKLQLKSENIGQTLKCCVAKGIMTPTSELLHVFRNIKSNRICTDE